MSCKASRFNALCSINGRESDVPVPNIHTVFRLIQDPCSKHTHTDALRASNDIVRYHWKTQGSLSTCRETCTFVLKCSISEWSAIGASIRLRLRRLSADTLPSVSTGFGEHLVKAALASLQQFIFRDWKISYRHKHVHTYTVLYKCLCFLYYIFNFLQVFIGRNLIQHTLSWNWEIVVLQMRPLVDAKKNFDVIFKIFLQQFLFQYSEQKTSVNKK